MIIAALRKIEEELHQLAADAKDAPVDGYHLAVLARKVAAQREMIEEGLVG